MAAAQRPLTLAGHVLDGSDALLLGLVREHRAVDHVADGPDAGHVRLEVRRDNDAAHLVLLDAQLGQAEARRVGPAARRDEHDVKVERLRGAALGGLDRQLHARVRDDRLGHLAAHHELHALLGEDGLELVARLVVRRRDDAVEELDDRHLRAQAAPDRAHLEADDAAADHGQLLRHALEHERARRVDDAAAVVVDGRRRQRRDLGARGDEHVSRLERAHAALVERGLDLARARDLALALDVLDAVLLEEVLDAARQALDALGLGRHHEVEVRRHVLAAEDAVVLEVLARVLEEVRAVQQRLGRDAAHVQARAAQRAAELDARHLHAELAGLDRRHVAARAAAHDDEVVLAGRRRRRRRQAARGAGARAARRHGGERGEHSQARRTHTQAPPPTSRGAGLLHACTSERRHGIR